MGWIIAGKEYSQAEYEEYQQQKLNEQKLAQAESWRLIKVLGEAYTACSQFMEQHPERPYQVPDTAAREQQIYLKLRENLEAANQAPRCEKVREDGTVCGSPQMKGYLFCYAHERMLQMQTEKLELPAQEDGNSVQMAIMRVQKALINGEISDKRAGLLLYSLQMASSNLKHTTFTSNESKDVVVEMPDQNWETSQLGTVEEPGVGDSQTNSQSDNLPQMNADKRRSGGKLPELPELPKIAESERSDSQQMAIGKWQLAKKHSPQRAEEHQDNLGDRHQTPITCR